MNTQESINKINNLNKEIKELEYFVNEICRMTTGGYSWVKFLIKKTTSYKIFGSINTGCTFDSEIKVPEFTIMDIAAKCNLILDYKKEELSKLLNNN